MTGSTNENLHLPEIDGHVFQYEALEAIDEVTWRHISHECGPDQVCEPEVDFESVNDLTHALRVNATFVPKFIIEGTELVAQARSIDPLDLNSRAEVEQELARDIAAIEPRILQLPSDVNCNVARVYYLACALPWMEVGQEDG